MSVADLLAKAVGGKKKQDSGIGVRYEERYMHSMGENIVLQKVGADADDIVVSRDKICIRTSKIKDCFVMGMNDYFQQGSICELASIDANGTHYVINDTWEPDSEVCIADRILISGDMKPSLTDRPVYVKLLKTGSISVINIDGEFMTIRPGEWTNLHNTKIEPGFWYDARIVWCDGFDKPAVVRLDWGIAPPLKYYIELMTAETSDHLNGQNQLRDGVRTQYQIIEMNENIMLNNADGEDKMIPASRVLIRRSGWGQYFQYVAGDHISNGSPCGFDGISNDGMYLLTNDTWDPGHNCIAPSRIKRTGIMSPDYISEDVYVMLHTDGGVSIINDVGEYAERPKGMYSMLNGDHLIINVWYSGTMNWEKQDIEDGQFPLLSVRSDNIAPTLGAYVTQKGYDF